MALTTDEAKAIYERTIERFEVKAKDDPAAKAHLDNLRADLRELDAR